MKQRIILFMTLAKIGWQTSKLINQTQKQVWYRYSLASDMNTGLGPAKPCDCEHLSGQGGHWEFREITERPVHFS